MLLFNTLHIDLVLFTLLLCFFILGWVFIVLVWQVVDNNDLGSVNNEDDVVELGWTIFPPAAVSVLCFLNLQCLGDGHSPDVTTVVKAIGRQWYWSYEVVGADGAYDSLMLDFIDSVDKPLRLVSFLPHTLVVTSSDVIHSFALPYFNVKLDAVPGRVSQISFCPGHVGVFVGYCSELCGAGHAYMPIVLEVVRGSRS